MFCRYLLIPVGSKTLLALQCPCSISVSMINESGVLKSPTIIVWGEMNFMRFIRVSFMNVGDFVLGAYLLRIESSTWQISQVMSKKCPSLSFLITFCLKFFLFHIRIATPACLLGMFAWKFFPTLLL